MQCSTYCAPAVPGDAPARVSSLAETVYYHFRKWGLDGRLRQAHERLRSAVRDSEGRTPDPSGAVIDSQALKSTGVGGPERGYDGAKRLFGRKRRILVDALEAPGDPETPSEPVRATEEGATEETPPEPQTAPERGPWWRRMLGG